MKNTRKVLVDTFDIEFETISLIFIVQKYENPRQQIFIHDTAFLLTWGQKVSG